MSNKSTADIGIKIVNGTLSGVGRFSYSSAAQAGNANKGSSNKGSSKAAGWNKRAYFEELKLSGQDSGDFSLSSVLPPYKKIFLILPPEIVSFKILTYPFKLKGGSNIEMLAKTAIEELTPLNTKELIIAKHKLSDHTLLIEYAKKETVAALISKYGLGDLKGLRIYFPFSSLCKIGKRFCSENDDDFLLKYDFSDKSYAVIYKKGKVRDIIDLNFNNEQAKTETNIIDLNAKAREIFSCVNNNFYSDLIFLIDGEDKTKNFIGILNDLRGLNAIEYFKVSDIIGGESSSAGYVNYKKAVYAALTAGLILIFIFIGLIEEDYYKNAEKAAISKKINLILEKYIPGQKVFYEPRYEIKSYYEKIKKNSGADGGNNTFLDFLNYISKEKQNVKGLKIDEINYSFKKIDFKGIVSGYNNLHKLEVYLKKRYSAVNVIKSYKNLSGNIKFNIILKQ